MMNRQNLSGQNRRGFTLIEMLVVIAILGVLAAMVVFMFPSFTSKKKAINGAGQLQGYLYIAKSRALRDGAPRGLRLVRDVGDPTKVTQVLFTEVPDEYVGQLLYNDPAQGRTRFYMGGVNLAAGIVQVGDYLEIQGVGLPHRIVNVGFDAGQNRSVIDIDVAFPLPYDIPLPGTMSYRIQRAPRISADEPMDLPEDVVIDLATNYQFAGYLNPLPSGYVGSNGIDILFSPSGKVITPGITTDFIGLWVRDVSYTDPFQGNPVIAAVHVRSGLVASHPPAAPPNADPYLHVKTGVNPE